MAEGERTAAPGLRPAVFQAAILALLLSCATTTPPEDRITTLVHDWFSLLERPEVGAADFEVYLAKPELGVEGGEGRNIDVASLRARHRELHSTYDQIVYRRRRDSSPRAQASKLARARRAPRRCRDPGDRRETSTAPSGLGLENRMLLTSYCVRECGYRGLP